MAVTNNLDFDGMSTHNYPFIYFGKSTDVKPVSGVKNGAAFIEMDKKRLYLFDAEDVEWRLFADFN